MVLFSGFMKTLQGQKYPKYASSRPYLGRFGFKQLGPLIVLFAGVLAVQGCDTQEKPADYEHRDYSDGGALCLIDEGGKVEFGETSPLKAHTRKLLMVEFNPCASGCATVHASECKAIVEASNIQVTAKARASLPVSQSLICPSVCVPIKAECVVQGDLLPGVTYTMTYGAQSRVVTVPGEFACKR